MNKFGLFLALAGVLVLASVPAAAQGNSDRFYASSERFGYTGTVSVYNTWADANSGRNPRCSATAWPQRDGGIFVVKNVPEYYANSNEILTNWWANNGASPSDTNDGFFQLADENADAWQNQKASWSRDRNTFTVTVRGRNATYGSLDDPKDYARLWNACAPQGSGETTKGTFLKYEYVFVATGLNGVEEKGFITNTTNASDYSGYFRGIFLNQSTESPASNGFYVFDLRFNNISWAVKNNCGYDGGAPQAVVPCVGLPVAADQFGGKK